MYAKEIFEDVKKIIQEYTGESHPGIAIPVLLFTVLINSSDFTGKIKNKAFK